jgi:hypothetical protein
MYLGASRMMVSVEILESSAFQSPLRHNSVKAEAANASVTDATKQGSARFSKSISTHSGLHQANHTKVGAAAANEKNGLRTNDAKNATAFSRNASRKNDPKDLNLIQPVTASKERFVTTPLPSVSCVNYARSFIALAVQNTVVGALKSDIRYSLQHSVSPF